MAKQAPIFGDRSGAKAQPTSLAESFATPRSSKRCRSRWVPPNGQFEGLSQKVRCLLSTIRSRPIHGTKCMREAVAVPKLCPNAIISIHLSRLLSESKFRRESGPAIATHFWAINNKTSEILQEE